MTPAAQAAGPVEPAGSPPPLGRDLARRLDGAVAAAQRRFRVPGIAAGVVRGRELVWTGAAGHARLDPRTEPTPETQFLIGSVTKTFTAVLVMQLRDAGVLALGDRLGRWLPGSRHADLTVADLLAHASGLQREPVGRIWESMEAPDAEELLRGLEDAEAVLEPRTAWHYSNLAYALLGQVVERETGSPWEDAVRARVLDPLGMTSTGLEPSPERAAHGFYVHPHARTARREPRMELRATAPLGGLWSSVRDLARYVAFVLEPDEAVLGRDTLEQMCRTVIMRDARWRWGHGLGWMLLRHGERVLVGHSGGMPGFVTGLEVDREAGAGAVVLVNSTAGADPMGLAWELVEAVTEDEPEPEEPWVPELAPPAWADLLGSWWVEGSEVVLEVRDGELWSRMAASTTSDARWEQVGPDEWRSVEGHERGERLEVVRDASGTPVRLYLASYAVTRTPHAFADLLGERAERLGGSAHRP